MEVGAEVESWPWPSPRPTTSAFAVFLSQVSCLGLLFSFSLAQWTVIALGTDRDTVFFPGTAFGR